jgi:hypothetical protein
MFDSLLGCVDISSKPDQSASKAEETKQALIQFFKSREETPVMLNFVEKTLDQMTLLVQMVIVFPLFFAVLAGRDHRFSLFFCNAAQEFFRVIRAIGNYSLKIKFCNQVIRLGDIVTLSSGQEKAQRVAQRIYAGVDLGAEAAPAAPERLAFLPSSFFDAPAAQGCARTMVLSSKICSISGSLANC